MQRETPPGFKVPVEELCFTVDASVSFGTFITVRRSSGEVQKPKAFSPTYSETLLPSSLFHKVRLVLVWVVL
jgi:hypothetical protein